MYITIKGQLSWNLLQPTQLDCRQAALAHAHHLLATRRARTCLLAAMVCNLVSELLEIFFNLTFLVLKNPFQSTNTKVPTLRFCIFPKISSKLLKYNDFSFNCTCRKFYIWWIKVSTFLLFHYLCLTSLFIVWMLLLGPSIAGMDTSFSVGSKYLRCPVLRPLAIIRAYSVLESCLVVARKWRKDNHTDTYTAKYEIKWEFSMFCNPVSFIIAVI